MGGYKAGELASALAVTAIYREIAAGLQDMKSAPANKKSGNSIQTILLRDAIIHANSGIYETAQKDSQCHGMGTTIVAVLFHDGCVTVGHVGDSRLYRKRANDFQQITKDHSLIQELIDRGMYTPEEAAANTPKNLVTRALGIDNRVEVEVNEVSSLRGDIYLLCSDGLNDMVDDEEIHLTLSKYSANLIQAAEELVGLANRKGGKDNISVIIIRVIDTKSDSGGFIKQILSRFF
jgi:protein phosphatase